MKRPTRIKSESTSTRNAAPRASAHRRNATTTVVVRRFDDAQDGEDWHQHKKAECHTIESRSHTGDCRSHRGRHDVPTNKDERNRYGRAEQNERLVQRLVSEDDCYSRTEQSDGENRHAHIGRKW